MESNKKENLKYYYKKPGSIDSSPSIVMSANGFHPMGGEIIIGKDNVDFSVEQMIVLIVKTTLDPEFHKIIEKQKKYFGEKHYEPARQEIIRLNKTYLQKLKDKGITLPMPVVSVVFDGTWKF